MTNIYKAKRFKKSKPKPSSESSEDGLVPKNVRFFTFLKISTVEVHNSLFEQLQEAVQEGPKPQEVKVVNVQKAEN